MSSDGYRIMRDAGHEASDVLASVVYARVQQCKKRGLNELASGHWHGLRVLVRHAEFYAVEETYILEEAAAVDRDLAQTAPLQPA